MINRTHKSAKELNFEHFIFRYMARKGEIKETLYPVSEKYSRQLSKVDEFLEWQHLTLRRSCECNFRRKWLEPMMGIKRDGNQKEIQEFEKLLEVNMNILEDVWLKDTPYLTGNDLTAADIFGACEIEQTSRFFKRFLATNCIFIRVSRAFWIQRGSKTT